MHDTNHALGVVREKLDLPTLELSADDHAEIDFGDGFSIFVTGIEPTVVEFSFRLSDLAAPDPAMMRALLEANALGAGTGAGRLALEADGNEPLYCERWDVAVLDAAAVEARFAALVAYGTYWKTEGTDLILAAADKHRTAERIVPNAPLSDMPEIILRA